MAMKVWKRVLEALCSLNDLLHSSQASLIALFIYTAHADSIRMSVVACRVNLFTHTTHADSIRMSVVACRVNLFTHTTHVDSIKMSVTCRVKMLLIVHAWHMVVLVCSLKSIHTPCIVLYTCICTNI